MFEDWTDEWPPFESTETQPPHLDVDEWMAILDCIAFRCKKLDEFKEASYLGLLESIRDKIVIALGVDDEIDP